MTPNKKDRPRITSGMTVSEVLWAYPETWKVFDHYGWGEHNERQVLSESVNFFSQIHGLMDAELIHELHETICEKELR